MQGKVVVCCLMLILLRNSALGSFVGDIADKVKESDDGVDDNLATVLYLLAARYTPQCLWVVVSEGVPRQYPWGHAYITLDTRQASKVIDYLNKHTERVTLFSCFTFLMIHPPDPSLFPVLTDASNMQLTRYFIVHFTNESKAHDFLLDKRLIDQENVAALVQHYNPPDVSIGILIRQLFHSSGSTQVLLVNRWEEEKGLSNEDNIFPEQMNNFYGTKLRGVTLDFLPFTDYKTVEGSRVVVPKPSLDVFILEVIADKLNFTYELVMPEDNQWGVLKDGHWSGVVGDVEFRRANFSLVLSLTYERLPSVDFTRVYFNDPLSFVTAKSRPSPPWLKLIKPFSSGVWLLALLSIAAAVILYYIIYQAQAFFGSFSLVPSRAFMHIFGAFVNQSLFIIPWLSAGRVFLGSWLLYSLLLTTYYKTSLTAALAVPFNPPTLDTLLQLFRSNLDYGMIDAKGSEYQLLSTSNVSLYKMMFPKMSFLSSDESMEMVQKGTYGYIYFKSNLKILVRAQYTNANGQTDLHVANEEFFPGGYAWAFPKGAPYRKSFDGIMAHCLQAGLTDKWLEDLDYIYLKESQDNKTPQQKQKEKLDEQANRNDGQVVLSLNHLQGPFLILLLGSASGVVLLLLECFLEQMLSSFHRPREDNPRPVCRPRTPKMLCTRSLKNFLKAVLHF